MGNPPNVLPDGHLSRGDLTIPGSRIMRATVHAKSSPPLSAALGGRAGLRRVLPSLAADLSRGVRSRTLAGRDVSGRTFAPKADGAPSTLRDSGAMVRSFGLRDLRATGFVLAPGKRERRKAAAHQSGKGVPVRAWIGLGRNQIERARAAVADAEVEKIK